MSSLEIIGFILTIAGVILATNQTIFTWVISVFSPVIYIIVFYNSKLYADALLQVFFILLSVYGFFNWKNKQLVSKSAVKNWLPRDIFKGSAFVLLSTILFYFFLRSYTNSDVPLADAFLTSLSLIATYFAAKKIIQNWWIWILADILYTVLFLYKELYITSLLYFILVVLAINGLLQWKKQIQT